MCKLAMLIPREWHDILEKLHMMPGHWAKFLSLFEIIGKKFNSRLNISKRRDLK